MIHAQLTHAHLDRRCNPAVPTQKGRALPVHLTPTASISARAVALEMEEVQSRAARAPRVFRWTTAMCISASSAHQKHGKKNKPMNPASHGQTHCSADQASSSSSETAQRIAGASTTPRSPPRITRSCRWRGEKGGGCAMLGMSAFTNCTFDVTRIMFKIKNINDISVIVT